MPTTGSREATFGRDRKNNPMEQVNVFRDKDDRPTDEMVKHWLGPKYNYFQQIRGLTREACGETTEEWKFYGGKHGWNLKTFYKKRNLYFIGIYDGYFRIAFVFGDRAVQAITGSDISRGLREELANARKYAEGRGLGIRVDDDRHLEDIRKLLGFKISK